ncbi:MAG TPA: ORF6N domain-containing protein [Kiritimatiellia bacterium]|nr:ORF6N domain-containing protein [Kiritimatiellia bacterium]HMP33730.1 ORF6N domain-containing protein [Kiritimatiellia bacterium]
MTGVLSSPDALAPLIHVLRGQRVLWSGNLARLFGLEMHIPMQAVKRNRNRFPPDFLFLFDGNEVADSTSHIVTSSWGDAPNESQPNYQTRRVQRK